MKRLTRTSVLALVLLVTACASAAGTNAFAPAQLRSFERSVVTIQRQSGRDQFQVWLARTPAQQQQGLMWIRHLPADHGMLFVLPQPREMTMWMKNTYVPLDMLFVNATGRITHIARQATPQSQQLIASGGDVSGVLEILAGEAAKRGIAVGDRIVHPLLSGP